MDLTGLLPLVRQDPGVGTAIEQLPIRGRLAIRTPHGVRPALLAALATASPRRMLVVTTASSREAEELITVLGAYLPPERLATLPAWETLPHERLSPRSDTVAARLAVFRRLAHPEPDGAAGPIDVLAVPCRSLLQPVVAGLGELEPVAAQAGDELPLDTLVERLVAAAYTRVDMVERRGEFAVRGGIVDVFPPIETHPLRIEYFGDEIDEIRYFSVADQRSLEVAEHGLWAPPCRELLLTDQVRERARRLADELPGVRDMLERIAEGIAVEGMESLTSELVDRMQPVLELVPDDALVVLADPERIRRRAFDLAQTSAEFLAAAWTSAAAGAKTPVDLSASSFLTMEEAQAISQRRGLGWWTLDPFSLDADGGLGAASATDAAAALSAAAHDAAEESTDSGDVAAHRIELDARDAPAFRGDTKAAIADMLQRTREGWRVIVAAEGPGVAKRIAEQLGEAAVPARLVAGVSGEAGEVERGVVQVTTGPGPGFVLPGELLAVIAQSDITGRGGTSTKDMRKMPSRRRNVVDPLQLRPGDFVVHEKHGVAKFVEMAERTIGTGENAATREYLVLEYAPSKRGQPGDRLFVPADTLDQITKYVGGDAPQVNKMGGSDWSKTKGKARKAVKEIAGELIRLYSARMASPGYAYGQDTPWQRELEDAFPYAETPDQLVTIDEVKADMEKPVPMDRLICGDVGYGKTEIAVRAAFKAVQEGKQVAVLVPTTLLVQQHLETFKERYAPFGVEVRALSRFQTNAEAEATKDGLIKGSVDVVIGTHRILTSAVRFKDLGLVVIDEEQRFGVEHKETLKALRTNVDVLAMSATPIPRTLEMAVSGIREMSTLATPPEERHPVLTYVGPQDDAQLGAAIRRELLRDGQVFYVHNRVESIDKVASHLKELVPEARIQVAHGKMHEQQLEQVIVDFWEKRFDVLVCTTIVETGLDIANANTLIVENADKFGLSQLHQLRGRVGRGRERAYAYLMYSPDKPLTETAHERLATIAANTELGAGMAVAMKDLEIRGAGNLLGGEQSGHIAGVGFDLYLRMVSEAVADFRGEKDEAPAEVKIELPVDAHVPHGYIGGERLRLEAYTKLATAADDDALAAVREELTDRYGPIPEPVENLFAVARLRNAARAAGLTDITAQGKYVRFAPVELRDSQALRLNRIHRGTIIKPAVRTVLVPAPVAKQLGGPPVTGLQLLDWAADVVALVSEPIPAGVS